VGIVTDRDLVLETLAKRLDPGAVRVEGIALRSLITIDQDATVREAAPTCAATRCDGFPSWTPRRGTPRRVGAPGASSHAGRESEGDLGRVVGGAFSGWRAWQRGVAHLARPVQALPSSRDFQGSVATVLVQDLMSPNPVCVEPGAQVLRALDLMVDEGVRHLPVVDARRSVVGVITLDDLAAALPVAVSLHRGLQGRDRLDVREIKVAEVMTYAPDTVLVGTSAAEAARHMALKGIGCLPVVDERGELRGLLSETDLLQAFATVMAEDSSPARAGSRDERLIEVLRAERDLLGRDLALHDRVGPALAAMRLRSLEGAISRAERGELRHCVRCSGAIPVNRLRALPGTTLCYRCAREVDW
jgi:CBS domain-containing protein